MYLVNAAEMRRLDNRTIEEFGLPGRILMENAGRGAVAALYQHLPAVKQQTVGVMAGRGNNAGDGFVMARLLAADGVKVRVYLLAEAACLQGDAAANLALLPSLGIPLVEVKTAAEFEARQPEMAGVQVWVDALLGTGLNSPVRGVYQNAIEFMNASGCPILAVDIPSGLCANRGQVLGNTVRATLTATFAFAKLGHYLLPGAEYTGHLEIVEIGIPPHIVAEDPPQQFLITPPIVHQGQRPRPSNAHKGTTGHVLVLAGSEGKSGAAVLTTLAALRSGAGLVTLATPRSVYPIVASQLLEAMTLPLPEDSPHDMLNLLREHEAGKQVLALGPGLGTSSQITTLVHDLIATTSLPLVLDADALNVLHDPLDVLPKARTPLILTPHPGEMARLLGQTSAQIQGDRLAAARHLAVRGRVIVVLKGARTLVAAPDGRIWVNPTGNAGMASGGMGDALTGIIAGLMAQGATPLQAACSAVYLHGAAADTLARQRGAWGYLASDVIAGLRWP